MSNYLMRYKGTYRLKAPIDLSTNTFPRNLNGGFEDIDVYIDCYKNVQIYSLGKGILQAYIPSKNRGNNIIKAIQGELDKGVIYDIEETDKEVLFKFHAKYISQLEKYLKPKTNGAGISPFSVKNLPKNTSYKIPDEEQVLYKEIVEKIGKKRVIELTHMTNRYLKSLVTKKNTWEAIKSDMAFKCLKGKDYIHSIGKWNEYIDYLNENLDKL